MKILLVFTLYLISGPVSCFDMIGYPGGSVTIYSRHEEYGWDLKYFCKKPSDQCVYSNQILNTWSHKERVSLRDSSEVLTVIYRNLSLQDAGSYQCGEAGVWSHDVNLKVNEDPCCLGPKTVAGYLGETVTISCSYPEEFKTNYKHLFKQDGRYFTTVIVTTETQRGRFSISDDRSSSVLSVRISDVREDDGGVYFCGVWSEGDSVSYYSLYTEIQLQVTASTAPTSVPPGKEHFTVSSYKQSSPVIIISVCVCVVLLLIGSSALIFYKMRHKKHQGDTDRSPGTQLEDIKEVDGDYENDQPTDLNHMNPVYQNLKSNTNQSDPNYQNLKSNTNQSDPNYQNLKSNTNQSDRSYQNLKSNTNQSDPSYQNLKSNTNQSDPNYQNLKSNTNQSDSVYQSLDPETKEPDSVYYSLKPSAD